MSGIAVANCFRDRDILLMEKGELLSGATTNNAGFLISGFGEHFYRTAKRWGTERACEIQRIHLKSHQMIRELTNEVDRCGSLTIALTQTEAEELRLSHDWLRSNGFSVQWLDRAPAGLRNPAPALLNAEDGLLNSTQFWTQLSNDLPVKTRTQVTEVVDEKTFLVVDTTHGAYKTRRVVYCMNAFSGDLLPELRGRIIPLRGQMLELEMQSPPPDRRPVIAAYGEIYWNFTAATLRFGGLEYKVPDEEVGIPEKASEKILAMQLEWISEHLELTYSSEPVRTWCGPMGFTTDGFPIVGSLPHRRNQYVVAGMCGLGNSYAMICASWLQELIENDNDVIPAYFSSGRIWSLPEYSSGDWRSLYEAWNH